MIDKKVPVGSSIPLGAIVDIEVMEEMVSDHATWYPAPWKDDVLAKAARRKRDEEAILCYR